jgi:hypothetical protein
VCINRRIKAYVTMIHGGNLKLTWLLCLYSDISVRLYVGVFSAGEQPLGKLRIFIKLCIFVMFQYSYCYVHYILFCVFSFSVVCL